MRVGRYLLCLAATLQAGSALAQVIPTDEAQTELAGFADCLVSRSSFAKRVAVFLRTVPGSPSYYASALKVADRSCLAAAATRRHAATLEMKVQPDTLRDALYPALYRRDFGKVGPPTSVADVQPLGLSTEFDGNAASLPAEYRPARAFGDCVARKAPQDVHALLISKLYSTEEKTAVEKLKPAMGYCLSEGQTVKLNRAVLRAFVGEAMYKLAVATKAPSAS